MVHHYDLNGLRVQTGDLICTTDGEPGDIRGQFWRLIGTLVPGAVDHIVIYVGPGGRCVEAGAKRKVITFEVQGHRWDARTMLAERGIIDVLYGVAYPLHGRNLSEAEATRIRQAVAAYCLRQAELAKPYNVNLLDAATEDAFYCSQLAYAAYLRQGINLKSGKGIPRIPGTGSIVFPQEIWSGCTHKRAHIQE